MTGTGEPGRDEALERLASGLDAMRTAGADELLQRRIWGRVASPPPETRSGLGARLALGGVALGLVGATVFAVMARAPGGTHDRAQATQAAPLVPTVVTPGPNLKAESASSPPPTLAPATLRTGAGERLTARLAGDARVALAALTELRLVENGRPELLAGRVQFDVPPQQPGQPFEIRAGLFVIRVLGTRFVVERAADQLLVSVEEGRVEVERGGWVTVVGAGQSWRGEAVGRARRASSGRRALAVDRQPTASGARSMQEVDLARAALAAGDMNRALLLFAQLSRGSGPAAENALYETGRVLFDHLGRPRDALRAWRNYRARFPSGVLRAEVDLSIVEALAHIGDRERALHEAESFLERHGTSERRGEVSELVRALREGRAVHPR